ncbi:MAG: PocR ligand-binding domain-containing protein [Lachnospiraceae bacterium]|nr:PocR ligand-binding domain-containing protein [Lachnospiraceae bacterium]
MNIRYDVDKINTIISNFANITGLSIAFLDTDFNFITTYAYNEPEFCSKIQQCEQGRHFCYHSDMDMLKKCRKTKRFVSHVCHAGIIDSVMPIIKDKIVSGYIILGRIRPSESIEDIYTNISWLEADKEELQKCYLKVAYFSQNQIESIYNLLTNILFDSAIKIIFEGALKSAVDYIDQNITENLSISTLCKVSHTSKNTLYKIFRETFDCTINEYITSIRVNKAKYLLETTSKTIQEIGELVGAEDPAHFCRLFKKNVGLSPNSYRKDVRS